MMIISEIEELKSVFCRAQREELSERKMELQRRFGEFSENGDAESVLAIQKAIEEIDKKLALLGHGEESGLEEALSKLALKI